MNSQIDMLTANLYVLMVAQLELLKQDFRELATSVKESGSDQKYSSPQVIKYTEAVLQTENNFETLISGDKKIKALEINDFSGDAEKLDKILNDRVILCTLRYQAIVK